MESVIDGANTAYVLLSAALVLLMTPGLAFFYGGMSRSKNVLNMLMMSFISIGTVTVLWVIYGYAIAFGSSKGGLFGYTKGYLGLDSLTTGAGSLSTVVNTGGLPDLVFAAFQVMFAIITVALVSGAVADRMKFSAWFVFTIVWSTLVYFPIAHWVFGFGTLAEVDADGNPVGEVGAGAASLFVKDSGGWIVNRLGALDFAGGTAVHINAGVAALALILVLGKRKGFGSEPMRPHNLPFVMLGSGLLWFGWFGFNAGSALAANGVAGLAFMNTQAATAAAMLGWLLVERIRDKHATSLGAASGAVAGLVAITPACAFVNLWGALFIGVVAGAVCAVAVSLKHKLGYDDALDVVGVHLVGGLIGTLLIGVVADSEFAAGYESVVDGGSFELLGRQAVAAGAVLIYSFVLTTIIALAIKFTIGIRVDDEEEVTGIDQVTHAETAYEFGGGFGGGGSTLPPVATRVNA
ncbi:MAG: ammonia channel protein [Frankiales bacterium]|nr:ammonia channel protein [Frankiales bacterium]